MVALEWLSKLGGYLNRISSSRCLEKCDGLFLEYEYADLKKNSGLKTIKIYIYSNLKQLLFKKCIKRKII